MASLVVRGLDDDVKERLAARAAAHGRSMEAEVRAILDQAVRRPNIALALREAARRAGWVEDLEVPARDDEARAVDFS